MIIWTASVVWKYILHHFQAFDVTCVCRSVRVKS